MTATAAGGLESGPHIVHIVAGRANNRLAQGDHIRNRQGRKECVRISGQAGVGAAFAVCSVFNGQFRGSFSVRDAEKVSSSVEAVRWADSP